MSETTQQATVLATYEMQFRGKSVIDPVTKEKTIVKTRENFKVQLPYLTLAGVSAIVETGNDKAKAALLNAANAIIIAQAKKQVDEGANSQAELDLSKLDWTYISELSASDMTESTSPTKEMLDALAADYINIMPALIGISTDSAKNAAGAFANKFRNVKLRSDMLGKLIERLSQWFEATQKQEEFADAYEWLVNKANTYIQESEKAEAADLY